MERNVKRGISAGNEVVRSTAKHQEHNLGYPGKGVTKAPYYNFPITDTVKPVI